ncbi:MAG: hypothetical protein [Bacteriophage sp.]|nr:MAG: hypothetical protein [Bacteriophage sp.]
MKERKMIENMNYGVSLLVQLGEADNEITENLQETIDFLEEEWQDDLIAQDEEEEEY